MDVRVEDRKIFLMKLSKSWFSHRIKDRQWAIASFSYQKNLRSHLKKLSEDVELSKFTNLNEESLKLTDQNEPQKHLMYSEDWSLFKGNGLVTFHS